MIKDIFNFSVISGALLGIIFIVATQFSKNRKDKSVVYLNLVVLFLTLNNLQVFFIDNVFTEANFFIRNSLIPFYVLILPSFYAFLRYYLKVDREIKSFLLISAGLFTVEVLMKLVLAAYFYHEKESYFVAQYGQIEEIVNAAYTLFLFVKAFVLLFKYSRLFQYVLTFDNIKWLKNFMFLGSFVLLMWLSAIVLNLDKVLNPQIFIYYPLRLSCSILLYWIGYQGFYNYALMTERIELRKAIASDSKKKTKHLEAKAVKEDKFQAVKEYVEHNEKYLEPTFSLDNLSEALKISTSTLSQLINQKSGNNFSDYINQLRVDKAKKFLIDPEYAAYTIVAIGLECGFNSKSTFYTAFKKATKITPSEYRSNNS
ncbi:MAG: helix-turn-helix domain-containing protein [Flavobacterium sp.]|nr:helix-turn-helix domain-containing protein [Flavobacterium sp.]